jgi:5-formyltetrahydrofolate cyclo-ligase
VARTFQDLMTAVQSKQALRTAAFAVRAEKSVREAEAFARRLASIGPELAKAHGARAVSAFWSIGDEIPTHPLVAALDTAGLAVGLPVTGRRGTPLVFRRWSAATPLVAGKMNIPEPPESAEIVVPDLLFVPLAAFDRRGHRIGYGAGYYDLTLAALRAEKRVVAVGLAYAAQEVLFIPSEAHDEPLDFVVTEKDTIVFADAA